jgi:hypothetical protein
MARTRTTKKLAQRVDLNYFKRPTPFKRAKLWLSVLLPLLVLGWLAWRGVSRDSRVYSSGRMSVAHAVLENHCAVCHVQKAGEFSSKAADEACLGCHDGPVHHENEVRAAVPNCATCHVEHRGRVNISAATNRACAECHANLKVTGGALSVAAQVQTFEDGHPEFAAVRQGAKDPGTIKLNHAIHMKAIRCGPNGPMVQLDCGDCHRPAAANGVWPYADANYLSKSVTYKDDAVLLPAMAALTPRGARDGREYMATPKYATACAGCHLLTFDKRFDVGAPHDKPEVVHAFLMKKFGEYIAAHPGELREMQEPDRALTGNPPLPRAQSLTTAQWVNEHTKVAEELLWKKTCAQCHALTGTQLQDTRIARWDAASSGNAARIASAEIASSTAELPLPEVAPAKITARWLPRATFDHDAHRGFSCVGCHAKAWSSTETSDVLVPGIENCRTCHAPGPEHAESRCFECHTYHDWSKRKEVKPVFTLPEMRTGGG